MLTIGIDPGMTGASAVLDADGILVALHDTPTLTVPVARGTRQEYDLPGLVALLQPYAGNGVHVLIEEAQSMPGQGVRSMFTIGLGFGVWLGVLAALRMPYTRVRPGAWKRALGLVGKDKEAARLRAQQLFPRGAPGGRPGVRVPRVGDRASWRGGGAWIAADCGKGSRHWQTLQLSRRPDAPAEQDAARGLGVAAAVRAAGQPARLTALPRSVLPACAPSPSPHPSDVGQKDRRMSPAAAVRPVTRGG